MQLIIQYVLNASQDIIFQVEAAVNVVDVFYVQQLLFV